MISEVDLGSKAEQLHRHQRRRTWKLLCLVAPALAVIAFVVFVPLAWLVYQSFVGGDDQFSLENYQRLTASPSYYRVFLTTMQISLCTTLICVLLSYPVAYAFAHLPGRLATWGLLAILLPCWTSLLVRTYAWLVLLQGSGLVNQLGLGFGLWDEPLRLVYNFTGTLIGMVHIMLPFLILPLYAAMQRIDRNTMNAAASLGAGPISAFCRVFFPLSLPGLVAGSIIVFVLCLGFYVTPAVLGGGRVMMASNQIAAIVENRLDWGAASAIGVLLLLVTSALLYLATRSHRMTVLFFGDR